MLTWDRTSFDKGALNVFHLVPNASTIYNELVRKYGADNVFRGNGATDGAVLTKIIGLCQSGGNYIIRLYPGTFVAGAVVALNKIGLVIEGAMDNPAAAIWDCDATDCAGFTNTAAGLVLRNFTFYEPAAGVTALVTSSGTGTIIDNVIVKGGNITNTIATFNLTGDYSVVKNCRMALVQKGVLIGGSYARVENCHIHGTDTTAGGFGISMTAASAAVGQMAKDNIVYMGATNPVCIQALTNSTLGYIIGNDLMGGDTMVVVASTIGVANRPLSASITATVAWTAE